MFAELMNGNECIVDGYRTEGQATRRGAQAKQEEATERRPEDAPSGRERDRKRRYDVDDASPRFWLARSILFDASTQRRRLARRAPNRQRQYRQIHQVNYFQQLI